MSVISTPSSRKLISIVSPIYRAEATVEELCEEITKALTPLDLDFEIILVEDGSPDNSWEKVCQIAETNAHVVGIQFSRNFGQHYAITAGIEAANGDWIGVLDCDLQDHPKHLASLIERIEEGYDIVFARRQNKQHGAVRGFFSAAFAQMLNLLTDFEHDPSVGTFSIISRQVANAFLEYGESMRSYTILLLHMGFRKGYVDIPHEQRKDGGSSYSIGKLFQVMIASTISYTERPLQAISIAGLLIALGSFFSSIYYAVGTLFYERPLGWSSLIVAILLSTGLILSSMGVIGLYLGKALKESLNRPLYHVRSRVGRTDVARLDVSQIAKSN
ncbi:MAG: glycosyltransferase [Pseudomonadales bacterium]|nr:glycosyltransferase [Pseudomonadales bacterium]